MTRHITIHFFWTRCPAQANGVLLKRGLNMTVSLHLPRIYAGMATTKAGIYTSESLQLLCEKSRTVASRSRMMFSSDFRLGMNQTIVDCVLSG
jgi:hypothetical protein